MLEKVWPEQFVNGRETIALRTLEDLALRGELPGAFRPPKSRKWWIDKLAMLQEGAI